MTRSSQEQFDHNAEQYRQSQVHRAGPSLPVMLRMAAPQANDVVLDIATGAGNTALAFAPFVASVLGLDISEKMLEAARQNADEAKLQNLRFAPGRAEALPLESSSMDLVLARHAPHHFLDVPAFLYEVRRVLRPTGRFIMTDQITRQPADQTWMDEFQRTRDPSHHHQRTVLEWQDLAAQTGLCWAEHELVPYHLGLAWWLQTAGCDAQQIQKIHNMLATAPAGLCLERDAAGAAVAFTESMLVVRLEPGY